MQAGDQEDGGADERKEGQADHDRFEAQACPQQRAIERQDNAEPAGGGRAVVRAVSAMARLVKAGEEHWRHGHRDGIGGEHGKGHGQCERHEEIFDDAGEEHDGEVHDQDADRRHQNREGQLRGAVLGGRVAVFAHLQMAMQVFLHDDVVVQQGADHERQPAERHDVHALAGQIQRDERGGEREGNRQPDDERGLHAPQEQENHQAGQRRPKQPFFLQIGNRLSNIERLVVDEFNRGAGGNLRQRRQLGTNPVGHFQCIRPFLSRDGDIRGLAAVHPHDRGLNGGAVRRRADVAHEDRCAVHDFDGDVVDLIDYTDQTIRVDVVVQIADLHVAGWNNRALGIDRFHHVGG